MTTKNGEPFGGTCPGPKWAANPMTLDSNPQRPTAEGSADRGLNPFSPFQPLQGLCLKMSETKGGISSAAAQAVAGGYKVVGERLGM